MNIRTVEDQPGGTLIFVLFPEGIRETAGSERNNILTLARQLFTDLSLNIDAVNYETPSFEQVEMLSRGVRPLNWRYADIIVGHLSKPKPAIANKILPERGDNWVERRIGCGRLFVNREKHCNPRQFLDYADPSGSILSSPSRRAVGRDRANVLSSRGHGLCCRDPARLIELVESIKGADDIDSISSQIAESSREIFRSLANDLWGRFILCRPRPIS